MTTDELLAKADAWLSADERHCWEGGLIRDLASALRATTGERDVLRAAYVNADAKLHALRFAVAYERTPYERGHAPNCTEDPCECGGPS